LQCVQRYGSREVGILLASAWASGLWVAPWGNYVEIVDSEGKPVPNNTEGEILVTSLTNYAMPFSSIPNRRSRIISFSENNGKDKNRKVLREVLGRISDTFKNKNGTLLILDILNIFYISKIGFLIFRLFRKIIHLLSSKSSSQRLIRIR